MKRNLIIVIFLAVILFGCERRITERYIFIEKEIEKIESSGELTIYTALDDDETKVYFSKFEELYNVKINSTRMSTGEMLKTLDAERGKPSATIVYGGTQGLYINGAAENLFEPYKTNKSAYLEKRYYDKNYNWYGIYIGAIGFGCSTNLVKNLPHSWRDLLDIEYQGLISMANPASSGTSYTIMSTLISLWGEEEAFIYLKELNRNIKEYTSSGSQPVKLAGINEVGIGIVFSHDVLKVKKSFSHIELTFPKEGTGYEIGGVALVKGSPNRELGKKFIDFALSTECQDLYATAGNFRLPLNPKAKPAEGSIPITEINIVNLDLEKMSLDRDMLIKRWTDEVAKGDNK